ncbi:MAG: hypothetical protein ACI9WU_000853 [Myxococcota bacterium]|jgi:hypothetical protein
MIRVAALVLVLLVPSSAVASDPFTTRSETPIGVNEEGKLFVAIDQQVVGTETTFKPVAYLAPRGKKPRGIRIRSYKVDTKDAETEARTKERADKVRLGNDGAFEKAGVVEATPIIGGGTGRYRIPVLGLKIYLEDNQILAEVGGIIDRRTVTLVKGLEKLTKRCKGTRTNEILHVVARPEWKSAAIYVQAKCEPEAEEAPGTRIRKLHVLDLSSLE